MILAMWLVIRIQKYINGRMEDLYGVSSGVQLPKLKPEPHRFLPPLDRMPEPIQTVIGKYGDEIHGYLGNTHSNPADNQAVEILRKYMLDKPVSFQSYVDELPEEEKQSVRELVYGTIYHTIRETYPNHRVLPILAMNQIVCSTPMLNTLHINGIFAAALTFLYPGTTVLRCLVGIQGNNSVDTVFPLSGNTYTMDTGNFLAFDYNRSVHYITKNERTHDGRNRVVLKLHYVVFPTHRPIWVGKCVANLHGSYNALTNVGSRWMSDLYVRLFLVGLFVWRWMGFAV